MRTVWLTLLALVLFACSSSAPRQTSRSPAPARRMTSAATDFKPGQIREAALVLRFDFAAGTFENNERSGLPAQYEGMLLDVLNAKALLTRDVRVLAKGEKFDARSAVARARELGADHVIFVDVRVERGEMPFCARSRQPFRASTTRWTQTAEVLRASDGVARFTLAAPGVQATELEEDCEAPRKSRKRSRDETLTEGVEALVKRVVGP